MSYDFKKITDLDLIEEVPEGANVLIETDGATKRLPSTAIKPAPIQSDLSQNDPSAPDYVKNRTHYEETIVVNEPLNITWDGNTEGKVCVEAGAMKLYKVSDIVIPNNEDLKLITFKHSQMSDEQSFANMWNPETVFDDAVISVMSFIKKDNVEITGQGQTYVFPEKGIYFMEGIVEYAYTTEPVEHTKTVVKKLDEKFLPRKIVYGDLDNEQLFKDVNLTTYCTRDEIIALGTNFEVSIVDPETNTETGQFCKPLFVHDEGSDACALIYMYYFDNYSAQKVYMRTDGYAAPPV